MNMLLLLNVLSFWILLLRLFTGTSAVEPTRISTVRTYKLEFFEGGKAWEISQKACQERDSWLVEIKLQEIFDAVMKLKKHHIIWIGAYYVNGWTWNRNSSIHYEKWRSGYPSGVSAGFNNGCGLMQEDGSWINIDCSKGYRYICQSDLTSGRCPEDLCSNNGKCEIINKKFNCTCKSGYFGTKCEKDLITISVEPKYVTLNKGQSIEVTLTTKSYDGNFTVAYERDAGKIVGSETFVVTRPGDSTTIKRSLGIQLQSVIYHFIVSPISQTYSRKDSSDVTILDHCASTPCMNGGTCSYALLKPYYTCTCSFEYEGLMCEGNRSFATFGNCKYHMKNDSVITSDNAAAICKKLGGSLTMIKTRQIQDFLQQEFAAKFGDEADQVWVGGHRDGQVWYWTDGTEINLTSPWQDFSETQQNILAISLPSSSGKIRWNRKGKSDTANGYICEVPVQNPCSSINCPNGEICEVVGCQANCNCTPASTYKIASATVARVMQSCVLSWSVADSAKGIIDYRINTSTRLIHSSSAKGRSWSAREEHEEKQSIYNYSVSVQYNRKYTFSAQIRTCLGLGYPTEINGSCLVERGPPESVPKPTTQVGSDGKQSVKVTIPDESNGPISCLFIVVVNGDSAIKKTNFGRKELTNAMVNSKSETLIENAAYIAIAISRQDISTEIQQGKNFTRSLGEAGAISSCNIATNYSERRKRSTTTTNVFEGRNRDLPAGKSFGVLTISTNPGNGSEVFFQASETTTFAIPSGIPPSAIPGATVGGISVAILVTVALVIVIVYMIKRKKKVNVKDSFTTNMEDLNAQHAYGNLAFDNGEPRSETAISVDQMLPIYNSMKARNSHVFQHEFQKLKEDIKALPYPTTVASAVTVSKKNRFRNILPSDRSRVVLSGEGDSTYINASFVNGYSKNRKFIATQGPLPNTMNDFWQMIIEQKCTVIVMLANCVENGKIKCEKYWPNRGMSKIHGDVKVENVNESSCGSYTVRKFIITKEEQVMKVQQFHFLSWPDHGVPVTTTNLLRFYNAVMKHQTKIAWDSPIVVHCSAGAGRTGTFIAYDYVLEEAKAKSFIDIFGCVLNLRAQRVDMVQTCGQYILLHKLLLEHYLLGETDIDVGFLDDLVQSSNGKSKLQEQFGKLGLVGPVNQMKHGDVSSNRAMNKNGDIVPYEANKVVILKQVDEMDVPYLNASTIQTHGGFMNLIAAQGPMKSSVDYFWRAIFDNGINIIVMLTQCIEKKKEQCFQYWPESSERDLLATDIIVHLESETGDMNIVKREFTVTRQNDKRTIKHYQYTRWSEDECPEDPRNVLDLVNKVQEDPGIKLGGAAIVHCSDGAGRTGSFCAILNLIERLKYEDRIDIFRSVKDIRDCRPGMVQTFDQFLFCHKAMSAYIKS